MISLIVQHLSNVFTWIVIVAPWEQALLIRLGSRVRLVNAGWYIRIPFIDRVYRQTIRPRMFTVRPQVLTTRDGRTLTISGAVGFRIDDLQLLFDSLHDALDTIEARIAAAIAEFVSGRMLNECDPSAIAEHVCQSIDLTLYGLADKEFKITNYAVIRTFRMITGDIPSWSYGNAVNTQTHDH